MYQWIDVCGCLVWLAVSPAVCTCDGINQEAFIQIREAIYSACFGGSQFGAAPSCGTSVLSAGDLQISNETVRAFAQLRLFFTPVKLQQPN
jgi:hypothetical protein